MSPITKLAAIMLLPLVYACSDSNNNSSNNRQPESAQLRVTHASADAPEVNIYVDGVVVQEALEFRQTSGLVNVEEPGTIEVEVRGVLPDGTEVTVIGPVELTLQEGVRTDVVAYGDLFDSEGAINLAPKVLDPVDIEEDIDDVRISVLHAAQKVGDVDIYVTAPGAMLADMAPIDLGFGDAAGPVAISANTEYQVRITADGSSEVVFDSGVLSFPGGTELVVVAVDNTYGLGPSPVTLLAVGPEAASEVVDMNMGSAVRVVHNSADTPAVDVLVDGAVVLDALTFTSASSYGDLEAPAGTYNVVVAADADNSVAPIDVDVTLEQKKNYSVIALGSLTEDTLEPLVLEDDRRKLATAAIVEVIHGSYLVAAEIAVDVYLTADGVIADAEPAIPNLSYKESTGQLPISPGAYWITVTAAGDKSVVAFDSGAALTLDSRVNYTIIARDPSVEEVVGSPLINVTLLLDE